MRVGLISHNVLCGDGQGRVNYELVRSLLVQGVEVYLLADRVAPDLLEVGAKWVPIHPKSERVNLVKVWQFAQLADEMHERVAHHYDVLLACGFVLRRPHAVNTAHFVHGVWLRSPYHSSRVRPGFHGAYQRLYSQCNARWEQEAFAQARTVVAVSEVVRQELIEIGVPSEKVEVIVNGVDLDEFGPGSADRTALGLPEDVPLALFAGDLRTPRKNLDTVLQSLRHAPHLHLAVAGGLDHSPYPAMAERLGVADRVHFLGFERRMDAVMRAADFFVFPSRYEACTLVLLEAMASGLPILTAKTTGGAELVGPEFGVVLDDPDDITGLAEGMKRFAADEPRRRQMGAAARAAAEKHSWAAMGRQYLDLFERSAQ